MAAGIASSSPTERMIDLLQVGGPVVWILCVFSVFALTLILLKFWQLNRATLGAQQRVNKALALWHCGEKKAALQHLESSSQPLPVLLHAAMKGSGSHGDQPYLREELGRLASIEMESLRSFLRPLEVIGGLSPLLGLLGTVMGMILAFQQMEMAGNQVDPSVLSGGIWQALLTTAAGLIVAIPVVLAHSVLERKTERIAHAMEVTLTSVFTGHCLQIPGENNLAQETWQTTDGSVHAA
ncbi:MotA/TolQ/ExbB proton channel family protein [Nitrincola tapanii]|uniref:MotA/TolQ/ExbB proton channel family protein n=2 Tax=Nitrincola tapanii TaxID=1708751 RepID=A0A5A9W4U0_9GAMM|nr:MotA/TolQ/ExbB proton channel family protein [Nitrincola tapanii]